MNTKEEIEEPIYKFEVTYMEQPGSLERRAVIYASTRQKARDKLRLALNTGAKDIYLMKVQTLTEVRTKLDQLSKEK